LPQQAFTHAGFSFAPIRCEHIVHFSVTLVFLLKERALYGHAAIQRRQPTQRVLSIKITPSSFM
jgi:hypothetical protein